MAIRTPKRGGGKEREDRRYDHVIAVFPKENGMYQDGRSQ
jgi:hypothetical protein